MNQMCALSLLTAAFMPLAACTNEARQISSDQPQTAPEGARDPRADRYEGNYYQLAQGGRYYLWYGCGECHDGVAGPLNLADRRLHQQSLSAVYGSIAHHVAQSYGYKIPIEQTWQIAAFVRDLGKNDASKNRRNALDQKGEAQATTWGGPIR